MLAAGSGQASLVMQSVKALPWQQKALLCAATKLLAQQNQPEPVTDVLGTPPSGNVRRPPPSLGISKRPLATLAYVGRGREPAAQLCTGSSKILACLLGMYRGSQDSFEAQVLDCR